MTLSREKLMTLSREKLMTALCTGDQGRTVVYRGPGPHRKVKKLIDDRTVKLKVDR